MPPRRGKKRLRFPAALKIPEDEITNKMKCGLCHKGKTCDPLQSGSFYKLTSDQGDQYYHYFCLLFSRDGKQAGKTEEGILGFLPNHIQQEVKRGQTLLCLFCKKNGATISCCGKNCRKQFHYPCAVEPGSRDDTKEFFFVFLNNMQSYCTQHAPTQSRSDFPASTPFVSCTMCMEEEDRSGPGPGIIVCKCGGSFHRRCLQKYADNCGSYCFKCPNCNSVEFKAEAERMGTYIPTQDASWEKPEMSQFYGFSSMVNLPQTCTSDHCHCPQGRDYNRKGSDFEVINCDTCGRNGLHLSCGNLNKWDLNYICQSCQPESSSSEEEEDQERIDKEAEEARRKAELAAERLRNEEEKRKREERRREIVQRIRSIEKERQRKLEREKRYEQMKKLLLEGVGGAPGEKEAEEQEVQVVGQHYRSKGIQVATAYGAPVRIDIYVDKLPGPVPASYPEHTPAQVPFPAAPSPAPTSSPVAPVRSPAPPSSQSSPPTSNPTHPLSTVLSPHSSGHFGHAQSRFSAGDMSREGNISKSREGNISRSKKDHDKSSRPRSVSGQLSQPSSSGVGNKPKTTEAKSADGQTVPYKSAKSQDLASKLVTTENLASKSDASQNLASKSIASQNLASKSIASQNLASKSIASQNLASKSIASQNQASNLVTSKDLASKSADCQTIASKSSDCPAEADRPGTVWDSAQIRQNVKEMRSKIHEARKKMEEGKQQSRKRPGPGSVNEVPVSESVRTVKDAPTSKPPSCLLSRVDNFIGTFYKQHGIRPEGVEEKQSRKRSGGPGSVRKLAGSVKGSRDATTSKPSPLSNVDNDADEVHKRRRLNRESAASNSTNLNPATSTTTTTTATTTSTKDKTSDKTEDVIVLDDDSEDTTDLGIKISAVIGNVTTKSIWNDEQERGERGSRDSDSEIEIIEEPESRVGEVATSSRKPEAANSRGPLQKMRETSAAQKAYRQKIIDLVHS